MKKLTVLLGICILALAAYRLQPQVPQASTKATRTPVTVTYRIENFDETGQLVLTEKHVYAYRTDGSWAHYAVPGNGHWEVVDFEKQISASVDPVIKAVSVHKLPRKPSIPADCESAWRGPARCLGPATEMILGYKLEKVTETEQNAYTNELLVAPALEWLPLRKTALRPNGSRMQDWAAIDVVEGEPAPSLFVIPGDYQALPRDEYYRQALRARGKKANPQTLEKFKAAEQASKFAGSSCSKQ